MFRTLLKGKKPAVLVCKIVRNSKMLILHLSNTLAKLGAYIVDHFLDLFIKFGALMQGISHKINEIPSSIIF
jgi:hypothetical protein